MKFRFEAQVQRLLVLAHDEPAEDCPRETPFIGVTLAVGNGVPHVPTGIIGDADEGRQLLIPLLPSITSDCCRLDDYVSLHYLLKHMAHLVQAVVWTAGLDDRLADSGLIPF